MVSTPGWECGRCGQRHQWPDETVRERAARELREWSATEGRRLIDDTIFEALDQGGGLVAAEASDLSAAGQNPATKAGGLLRERLGPARWRLFLETGTLMVPSRRWPGLDYRLRRGHPVEVIERGALRASLCAVSKRGEPEADRLLTILDLIETDERKLWEMAQVSYSGPTAPPSMPPPGSLTPQARQRIRWRKIFDPCEMESWWYFGSFFATIFFIVGIVSALQWFFG